MSRRRKVRQVSAACRTYSRSPRRAFTHDLQPMRALESATRVRDGSPLTRVPPVAQARSTSRGGDSALLDAREDQVQFERSVDSSEFRGASDDARRSGKFHLSNSIEHKVTEGVDMGRTVGEFATHGV